MDSVDQFMNWLNGMEERIENLEKEKNNNNDLDGENYPEPKIRIGIKSINFESVIINEKHPKVIVDIEVFQKGISLHGDVKLSKEEYKENAGDLEGYIFNKYFG